MVKFRQRCVRCKKSMVLMTRLRQIPLCLDCQMKDVDSNIDDPIFKKLFSLPREFYLENSFLRSIRSNYSRFGILTKNQVETFEKVVKEMKKEKKKKLRSI